MSARNRRNLMKKQRLFKNLKAVERLESSGQARPGFETAAVTSREAAREAARAGAPGEFVWGYKHEAAETMALAKSGKWRHLAHQLSVWTGGATRTGTRIPDLAMQRKRDDRNVWADIKAGRHLDQSSVAQLQELTGVKQHEEFGEMSAVAVISGQHSRDTDIAKLRRVYQHSQRTAGLPLLVRSVSMEEGDMLPFLVFEQRARAGASSQNPATRRRRAAKAPPPSLMPPPGRRAAYGGQFSKPGYQSSAVATVASSALPVVPAAVAARAAPPLRTRSSKVSEPNVPFSPLIVPPGGPDARALSALAAAAPEPAQAAKKKRKSSVTLVPPGRKKSRTSRKTLPLSVVSPAPFVERQQQTGSKFIIPRYKPPYGGHKSRGEQYLAATLSGKKKRR